MLLLFGSYFYKIWVLLIKDFTIIMQKDSFGFGFDFSEEHIATWQIKGPICTFLKSFFFFRKLI